MKSIANIWINVLNAILLRDVKVRAGFYFTGYIFIFILPFLHLFVVVTIFSLLGRISPVGTDQILYFGISITPFVIFLYPSQQIMRSVSANAPLLYFSRVKFIDILFARGALELINGAIVSILIIIVLFLITGNFTPQNPFLFFMALASALIFGFSFGALNALISRVFPMWTYAAGLLYPIFWALSGIIYFPHSIPEQYHFYIGLNPLLRCIEALRYSYFLEYPDKFVSLEPVILVSSILLAVTFLIDRFGRRVLLSA